MSLSGLQTRKLYRGKLVQMSEKIVWIECDMTDYGKRLTPWYIVDGDQTITSVKISRTAKVREFWSKEVFTNLEDARQISGVHRVFCFEKSACQHIDLINNIHQREGLVCPHCGPGTVLLEITAESDSGAYNEGCTHFCWSQKHNLQPPRRLKSLQVTFGLYKCGGSYSRPDGCGKYIKLPDVHREVTGHTCNCGGIPGHVPDGSYCRRPL